ncbi:MAG TPA: dephospho-CoA kinase [Candidatus Dormibacteraeota bacterium]|jgi:dephospho-CoA kinase|nr:dephospho-CoA kinase [Candidatus Dormibacteraeota bacterium]
MLKVGLTGGIASGKSAVGEMFVALGAHLVQADRIAHELMLPGQPVYNEVVRHFGGAILNPDLSVNRAKLAEAAFGSLPSGAEGKPSSRSATPSRIQELNRIVHPAVLRSQNEWMEEMGRQDPHAIAIVEAALILEAGAAKSFDRLIVVTCSDEQRIARFAARQKLDLDAARKEVERRMAAQMPDAEKIKAAGYVIDNSGSLEQTREQVQQVWEKLRALVDLSQK